MPKKNNNLTVAERVEALDFVEEVDALLLEGSPATDVARYIQKTMMKLKDVAFGTLVKTIKARRKRLEEEAAQEDDDDGELPAGLGELLAVANVHPAATAPSQHLDPQSNKIIGDAPRTPSTLSRLMYEKYVGGFNSLLEVESMYLAQRDRISWMMLLEQRLKMPIDDLGKELDIARKLLMAHANIQEKLGLTGDGRGQGAELNLSLTLKGLQSRLGADVLETLKDPQSRHKILNALRAITNDPTLPGSIIDGEATELG